MKVFSGCFSSFREDSTWFRTRTARRSFQRVGASTRMSSSYRPVRNLPDIVRNHSIYANLNVRFFLGESGRSISIKSDAVCKIVCRLSQLMLIHPRVSESLVS